MAITGQGKVTIFKTAINANDTSAQEPLGVLRVEYDSTNGEKTYMYVQASNAVTSGSVPKFVGAYKVAVDTTAAATATVRKRAAGVAIDSIGSGSYGWIQVRGHNQYIKVSLQASKCAAANLETVCGCGGIYNFSAGAITAVSGAVAAGIITLAAANSGTSVSGYIRTM